MEGTVGKQRKRRRQAVKEKLRWGWKGLKEPFLIFCYLYEQFQTVFDNMHRYVFSLP